MTLTFSPLRALVMTHSQAKDQGQRWASSKDTVDTNGWMDGGDCITPLANAVGNKQFLSTVIHAPFSFSPTFVLMKVFFLWCDSLLTWVTLQTWCICCTTVLMARQLQSQLQCCCHLVYAHGAQQHMLENCTLCCGSPEMESPQSKLHKVWQLSDGNWHNNCQDKY